MTTSDGCFWHGHDDPACRDGRSPRSNESYWLPKLTRNKERDAASVEALKADGWHVLVVWECETRDAEGLRARLESFLSEFLHRSSKSEGQGIWTFFVTSCRADSRDRNGEDRDRPDPAFAK